MEVIIHAAAVPEYPSDLREQLAMDHVVRKLRALGELLGFPHSSAVRSAFGLRELRPRAGRSPWRAFYRRIGDAMVVGAFGPEATVNPRGFEAACRHAQERLLEYEGE